MTTRPGFRLAEFVLDATDAHLLAAFYVRLLGWPVVSDEPDGVKLASPDGSGGLSFQTERAYRRPTWPASAADQQMMTHLDFAVDDLAEAASHAISAGAVLAHEQPHEDVRVLLDPDGHPFCLVLLPEQTPVQ
jgi:catechol 2,3-dioxygenase-like lactoylglutathione lyase family enzyme